MNITKAMEIAGIKIDVVVYSDEPVRYTSSREDTSGWPSNSAADSSTGEEAVVLGPHKSQNVEDGYLRETREITGGIAVLIKRVASFDTTTHRLRRAERLVVHTTANPATVAEWLLEQLIPEPIRRTLLREGYGLSAVFSVTKRPDLQSGYYWDQRWNPGELVTDGTASPERWYQVVRNATFAFQLYQDTRYPGVAGTVIMGDEARISEVISLIRKEIDKGLPEGPIVQPHSSSAEEDEERRRAPSDLFDYVDDESP